MIDSLARGAAASARAATAAEFGSAVKTSSRDRAICPPDRNSRNRRIMTAHRPSPVAPDAQIAGTRTQNARVSVKSLIEGLGAEGSQFELSGEFH